MVFLNLHKENKRLKFKKNKSYPKLLGIFAAFWAFLHFLNYFIFDRNANFLRLFDDISHRLLEASGFFAFIIIFLIFSILLKNLKELKNIKKMMIRKLGYVCLVLASYHYFLSPKVPMFWEWSALMLSLVYFMIRYLKFFKFKKA